MWWQAWAPHHRLDLHMQGCYVGACIQQDLHELEVRQNADAQISEGAAGAITQLPQGSGHAHHI